MKTKRQIFVKGRPKVAPVEVEKTLHKKMSPAALRAITDRTEDSFMQLALSVGGRVGPESWISDRPEEHATVIRISVQGRAMTLTMRLCVTYMRYSTGTGRFGERQVWYEVSEEMAYYRTEAEWLPIAIESALRADGVTHIHMQENVGRTDSHG